MKFEDEWYEEAAGGARRPRPLLTEPVDGMLVERRMTAGFADRDGRGCAGGGDVDEDEQTTLDALLTGPTRIRRIWEIARHVRHETFSRRRRGESGTGRRGGFNRTQGGDGHQGRHGGHRHDGQRRGGGDDFRRGRRNLWRCFGDCRRGARGLGRRREILDRRPSAMVMIVFGGQPDRAGQFAQHAHQDRRRTEGGGPGAEAVLRGDGKGGGQKVRSSASDLLLHRVPATARHP